jgi:hypothetical protein
MQRISVAARLAGGDEREIATADKLCCYNV